MSKIKYIVLTTILFSCLLLCSCSSIVSLESKQQNQCIPTGTDDICGNGIDEDCDGRDNLCQTCEIGQIDTRCLCNGTVRDTGFCCTSGWSQNPCPVCIDNDGDGYGSPASIACTYSELDCDDGNPNVNPQRPEICGNGIDDDCNPATSDICPAPSTVNISGLRTLSSPDLIEHISHGGSYRISGQGFGIKNPVGPAMWDTVDNQPMYAGLTNGDPVPTGQGFPWAANGDGQYTQPLLYSTNRENRGMTQAHYFFSVKGFLTGHDPGGNEFSEIFVTWWVKTSHDIHCGPGGCASTKLIRLWEDSNPYHAVLSWCANQITVQVNGQGRLNVWPNWRGTTGTWHRLETYINNPQGKIEIRTDNRVVYETSSPIDFENRYINRIWRIGLDPSYPSNLDQNLEFDFGEIYTDYTRSRVEICNTHIWDARTHCEIQIPQNIWNDGQIEFTANRGSFPTGQQLFIFAVNSGGTANSTGYPVRF